MATERPQPRQRRRRSGENARRALLRHRGLARQWGLFVVAAGLVGCAVVAPRLALLVLLALVFFGGAGLMMGWGMRRIARWVDGRNE